MLIKSILSIIGYLTEDEIRYVTNIYNSAYEINITEGRIQQAISNARSMDPSNWRIRIDLFCQFLELALMKRHKDDCD